MPIRLHSRDSWLKGFEFLDAGSSLRIEEQVMSKHPIMDKLAARLQRKDIPAINPGDTVRVQVKIKEGDKERVQAFEGTVISRSNGPTGSFTVRKVSFGQGVERIFPFNSKVIDKVEVVRSNQVRRAKLFYLRGLKGKAARLREVDRAPAPAATVGATEAKG
jgi:large subunit ribosomal protein L19